MDVTYKAETTVHRLWLRVSNRSARVADILNKRGKKTLPSLI